MTGRSRWFMWQNQFSDLSMGEETLIRLTNVAMVRDGRNILENVNLDINRGDFLAITGPNGGGKTTLLRIILKLLKPTSGLVEHRTNSKNEAELSIGYLPQKNMIDSHFPITVSEVVAHGLFGKREYTKEQAKRAIDEVLRLVEMSDYANHSIGRLSGGQLQRALFARAIISRPEVLVLDEPLSYLDKHFEQRIYDIIQTLAPTTTIILVSHEMSTIAAMANRHIIVDRKLHICHSANHFIHYDCCDNH